MTEPELKSLSAELVSCLYFAPLSSQEMFLRVGGLLSEVQEWDSVLNLVANACGFNSWTHKDLTSTY